MIRLTAIALIIGAMAFVAVAQDNTSSLYMMQPAASPQQQVDGKYFNPYMQAGSYMAVVIPPPREFKVHDLVTIIVRGSSTAVSEAELNTQKDVKMKGAVEAIIDLKDLLTDLQIKPAGLNAGIPRVDVNFNKDFEGNGDYERRDEVVTRLTAQVVDIKPNGTIALEARTNISTDSETVTITVTGYCRAEDVTGDNAILSTQMFDLRVNKQHTGELRKASKKGALTKALDFIFNF